MNTTSLKLIFRSWWRNKTFAIISLLSLAVGIACTNLLTAYVIYEARIEAENPNREQIIYMAQDSPLTTGLQVSTIKQNIPVTLKDRYPEVEDYLRISMFSTKRITIDDRHYEPIDILSADPSLTCFFPYEVREGDLNKALRQPNMIALSEERARYFFGEESPIGKTILVSLSDDPQPVTYEIAAIVRDHPQSYLRFEAVTGNPKDFYGGPTLLLVNEQFDRETFPQKLKDDKIPTFQGEIGQYYFYTLQDSYFQEYTQETIPYINRNQKELLYVGLFSAVLILLIACFNYVNLNFSRVLQQVRMIYTQRLMGASAGQIYKQLFTDTFLTVLIAFLISLLIMLDMIPIFNQIVSGRLNISFFFSGQVLPVLCVIILSLAIIPAFYMSRKIAGLSNTGYRTFVSGSSRNQMIAGLSIAQFVLSTGLVFATLTGHEQMRLTRSNGDRFRELIEIGNWEGDKTRYIDRFAKEIERLPGIGEMCLSKSSVFQFGLRQVVIKKENGSEDHLSIAQFAGDSGFLKVMRLPILRGLPEAQALKEYANPVYINERYTRLFVPEGENPIGKPVRLYDTDHGPMEETEDSPTIIAGIIGNIYTGTLRQEVYPSLTYLIQKPPYSHIHIRLKEEHKAETLALLKKTWEKINPNTVFSYRDLYAEYLQLNRKTIEFSDLLLLYSMISLLITASGLYGIARYASEQRTKEIGIRKVNGATTAEVMWLLTRRFILWAGIAFAVSAPVTWFLLGRWLENFAYRTELSIATCLLSGGIVLVITLLTVSGHSYKTASGDPVKALRND